MRPEEVFAPLPTEVQAALSPHTVDYESFTGTYVPAGELAAFQDLLNAHGLSFHVDQERPVSLPYHLPGAPAGALDRGGARRPAPGRAGAVARTCLRPAPSIFACS